MRPEYSFWGVWVRFWAISAPNFGARHFVDGEVALLANYATWCQALFLVRLLSSAPEETNWCQALLGGIPSS